MISLYLTCSPEQVNLGRLVLLIAYSSGPPLVRRRLGLASSGHRRSIAPRLQPTWHWTRIHVGAAGDSLGTVMRNVRFH